MNSDWQAIVSEAAVQTFLRCGKVPRFELARGDLIDLCAQVMKRDAAGLREDTEGALAFRVHVHCPQLDRAIVVDEWLAATP
jgi:hypothetical protein